MGVRVSVWKDESISRRMVVKVATAWAISEPLSWMLKDG